MTVVSGRHRARGRHRKPVQPNPARRKFTLRVVCGCAACAVVIPLFTQPSANANPPDLTSARPVLTVVPPISAPVVTLQPSVDAIDMTAVNGEPAKHHKKNTSSDTSSSSSDDSTPPSDTGSPHPQKDLGDYHQIIPPSPPACQ